MKVLDTTFLIDLLRGKPETQPLLQEKDLLTTQINMFEVLIGLFYRKASPSTFLLTKELFEGIRVLQLDDMSVVKAAEISAELSKKGETIDDCDCLIAGIMLSKKINCLVTKNTKHFSKIKGIVVESY